MTVPPDPPAESAGAEQPPSAAPDASAPRATVRGGRHGATLRSRRRSRRRRRRLLTWGIGAGVLLVLVVAAIWLVLTGLRAKHELEAIRAELPQLRSQLTAGDATSAAHTAAELRQHADQAHRLTTGPAWWTAALVPYLGDPVDTVRVVSAQASRLADDAVPGVVTLTNTLKSQTLRSGGQLNLNPLLNAKPVLDRASTVSTRAIRDIRATSAHSWLSQVDSARSSVLNQLVSLDGELSGADRAVDIVVPMLGQGGTHRYFIAFENEAESRGLGGLPGAYAIATASRGTITFTSFGTDDDLADVHVNVNLGDDFANRYGQADPQGTFNNSNMSPNFPDAGRLWAAYWQAKSGQKVDGAIALDPTALSYLLNVTGPVALPGGRQASASNIVALTQQQEYTLFASTTARKQFLVALASSVATALLHAPDPTALVHAATQGASERRLMVWSADPATEALLQQTSFSGTFPDTPAGRTQTGFVINNAAGTKLDYYLQRGLAYRRTSCAAGASATATFTLHNGAPASGLPPYVYGQLLPTDHSPAGTNTLLVTYYASRGATITGVELDGAKILYAPQPEFGTSTVTVSVTLPPGATRTMTVSVREPAARGAVQVLTQPGVNPERVDVSDAHCSG